MINFLIYFFYRPIYSLLKALAPHLQAKLDQKTIDWFKLRDSKTDIQLNSDNVFWFHASSGEIEYAKAIIRDLKTLPKETIVVVTYSSPSAVKLFENIKNYVDHFIALPWDQPEPIADLIRRINPKALIFARTDLWPELIFQLKKFKVPCFIASFNPSLNFWNRLFNLFFLNHFKGIFCVHPAQASILNSMLSKNVSISAPGDTRFDQVFWRLSQPSKITFPLDFSYGVLGSTWPEDENIILPNLPSMIQQGYKIFWCPHETNSENIERIELQLLQLKISYKKFSEMTEGDLSYQQAQVILVDKVGLLADLYRTAAWAFVGGSFKAKVHSVMEPLCCAVPVITGPHIQNSPEALRYNQVIMNDLRIVEVVHDSKQFLESITKLKTLQIKDFKKMLIGHLEQNRYASIKIVRIILDMLQEKVSS